MLRLAGKAKQHNPLGYTRTQVAIKLLALGPLSGEEFCDITGWVRSHSWSVLYRLRRNGVLKRRFIDKRRLYVLPGASRVQ